MMSSGERNNDGRRLARFFPVLTWLPGYDKVWFRSDLVAAVTVAAFAVPNLMAFSMLAGLPPVYGIYAGIGAGVAYFIFGTVKRLSLGPSATQAILLASVLGVIAANDPERYLALAILTSFIVGVIFLLARMAKLGFIINLIPLPVFKGFFIGMGLTIIMSQVPRLFGITGASGDFFSRLFYLVEHIGETNFYTLGAGLLFVAMLFALDWRFKKLPNPLIVVVFSIFLMTLTDLPERGVELVGHIPTGFPTPEIPDITTSDIRALLPLAFSLFILSFVETTSIGKALETKHDYKMDPDQELVALGVGNISSGLLQGFPVSASASRSMLNDSTGAKTQLSSLLTALLLAVVAIGLTALFENMPQVILGVLVIVAVSKIIDWKELHRIRTINRTAFLTALASLAGVLIFGVLEGVVIGVFLSFVYVLYRLSTPPLTELGRIPGTDEFRAVSRHPENITLPGVLIVRSDAPLLFASSHRVRHQIMDRVLEDPSIRLVILDMETSPMLDITAADMLGELDDTLNERGISFRLANPTGEARDILRSSYSEERVGHIDPTTTICSIVDGWGKEHEAPAEPSDEE